MKKYSIARRDFLKSIYSVAALLAVIPVSLLAIFSKSSSSRSSISNNKKSDKRIEAILQEYGAEFGGKEAVLVSQQKKGGSHGRI